MNDSGVLAQVIAFFEHVAPNDLARIGEIYAADAYFRDPFNEVRGVAAIVRVYGQMFEQLDDCRFAITERSLRAKARRSFGISRSASSVGDRVSYGSSTALRTLSLPSTGRSAITAITWTPRKNSTPSCH